MVVRECLFTLNYSNSSPQDFPRVCHFFIISDMYLVVSVHVLSVYLNVIKDKSDKIFFLWKRLNILSNTKIFFLLPIKRSFKLTISVYSNDLNSQINKCDDNKMLIA